MESPSSEVEESEKVKDEGNEAGEEGNGQLLLDDRYDDIGHGIRLIISYNSETKAFEGTVENISEVIVRNVQVEVHLSNNVELGPTDPIDLDLGEKRSISLDASGQNFERWSAHAQTDEGPQ